jgi:hypothetical protein
MSDDAKMDSAESGQAVAAASSEELQTRRPGEAPVKRE